ncbi:deoxycytidylate deaminase [Streptomyces sp. NPDC002698]|uniref:deoxycytidylate deaminase n=1 Tax=Streptomyces sp. NPDC002698 TaxID=3364660 RepID=UPI0036AC2F23
MSCQELHDCELLGEGRPCWDCYFLGIAEAAKERGDCVRKKVGAVLVTPEMRVASTGYNGSDPGGPSCLAGECPRCLSDVPSGTSYEGCVEYHAEHNALMWACPVDLVGSTLYVTFEPCGDCRELIRGDGLSHVVWLGEGHNIGRWKV